MLPHLFSLLVFTWLSDLFPKLKMVQMSSSVRTTAVDTLCLCDVEVNYNTPPHTVQWQLYTIHVWDTRATRVERVRETRETRGGHARGTRGECARDTWGTRFCSAIRNTRTKKRWGSWHKGCLEGKGLFWLTAIVLRIYPRVVRAGTHVDLPSCHWTVLYMYTYTHLYMYTNL